MTENETLLAHMIPWLTSQVEVAATRSLTFILNKSPSCRTALDGLLSTDGFAVEPIVRLTAEESLSPTARLDLVGYDSEKNRRLLIEAKFWASLSDGQVSEYVTLLEGKEPGVLLFLCPHRREESLWRDVKKQLDVASLEYETVPRHNGLPCLQLTSLGKRVALVSWRSLLDEMASRADNDAVLSDIRQLRGLTETLNDQGFAPLTPDLDAEDFAERDARLRLLAAEAVDTGKREGWIRRDRLQWGVTSSYCRRYFSLKGTSAPWVALSIEYRESRYQRTPLWLMTRTEDWEGRQRLPETVEDQSGKYCWTPVNASPGADFGFVLADVVARMRELSDALCDDTVEDDPTT